jgi:DNA-binding transcriptional LysR family regulator
VLDRFEDLRTFVTLVQAGGFNAAADRLGIVKSAVSRRIRELEQRLDVRLVQRTTRQISLTDAGRAYHERAAEILAALDALDDTVRTATHEPAGTLRISAPVSFSIHCLARAIVAFQARYPAIAVDVETSDRFVDIVHDGYDLAVRIARLKDSALIARRIVTVRHLVCASPAYLDAHGRPATLDDLAAHHGIVYSYKDEDAYWTFRDGVVARPEARLRLNNGDVIREAAIGGAGLAYLPSFVTAEAIARGELEIVLPGQEREPIAMHAVFPASQHVPARVRLFIDFLVEEFGDNPRWDRLIEGVSAAG